MKQKEVTTIPYEGPLDFAAVDILYHLSEHEGRKKYITVKSYR